jgi:hypothetical protein
VRFLGSEPDPELEEFSDPDSPSRGVMGNGFSAALRNAEVGEWTEGVGRDGLGERDVLFLHSRADSGDAEIGVSPRSVMIVGTGGLAGEPNREPKPATGLGVNGGRSNGGIEPDDPASWVIMESRRSEGGAPKTEMMLLGATVDSRAVNRLLLLRPERGGELGLELEVEVKFKLDGEPKAEGGYDGPASAAIVCACTILPFSALADDQSV